MGLTAGGAGGFTREPGLQNFKISTLANIRAKRTTVGVMDPKHPRLG